jgi:hypothetical protein
MVIVEIWNHLFYVFVPRILPAAGLLWYLVEGWMEKSVFYPVQCGFKHKMWDRERDGKKIFLLPTSLFLVVLEFGSITPAVFPQARSLNYATFIITWLFSFMLYWICKMVTQVYVVRGFHSGVRLDMFFWFAVLCSVEIIHEYICLRGTCCLILQVKVTGNSLQEMF